MKRREIESLDEERVRKKSRAMETLVDLNSLPREIHQQIASHLEDRAKRQMRAANPYWFKIVNYTNFHVYLPRRSMMNELIERLSSYTQPICLTFSKQQQLTNDDLVPISRLTNLKSLIFDDAWLNKSSLNFSTLTNLEFFRLGSIYDNYPWELLENFTRLRAITFYKSQGVDFDKLARIFNKLPYLEDLQLFAVTEDVTKIMSIIPTEKLTNLEAQFMVSSEFVLSATDGDRFTNLKTLRWENRAAFPISNLINLVSLKCNSSGHLEHIHRLTGLTQLRLQTMDEPYVDHLAELTNLESLAISSTQREEFDFLRSLTKLHTLSISAPIRGDFFTIVPHENLTHLKISSAKCEELTTQHLERFSNLQKLDYTGAKLAFGCKHLTRLKHVTYTNAYIGKMQQDFIDWSLFVQLEELIIPDLQANTLMPLTNLTHLQMKLNEESDFKFLENKPLKHLDLDMIDTPELWSALTTLTSLERLKMTLIEENDEKIAWLSGLTHLTSLSVSGKITGEYFTCLTSLQVLELFTAGTTAFFTKKEQLVPFLPNLLKYDNGQLTHWRGKEFAETHICFI
jgi:hypothetical protein